MDATAPRLGGEPGAEAFLSLAEGAIERVGLHGGEDGFADGLLSGKGGMGGQEAEAGEGAVDAPTPGRLGFTPLHGFGKQGGLGAFKGAWPAAAKQFLQKTILQDVFGQVHIDEHEFRRVEDLAAVGVAGDGGGKLAGVIFEFTQDFFAHGAVITIGVAI